jgi:phosphopantetheine adenylyltransferase
VIFTHFICKEKYLHVSSSYARELASLDEDVSWLVTPSVARALAEELEARRTWTMEVRA